MRIEQALEIVKKRYGLVTSYVDAGTGRMIRVVKAEDELRAIPEVKFPEGGIALFASDIMELAGGNVSIRDLVERKNPEIFHKNFAAVALGSRGGQVIAQRGAEYFRQLQAKRTNRMGGRPRGSKNA